MGRAAMPVGHEELTPQGYIRVKTAIGVWRLKHHLIAEEKIGRPLRPGIERVIFKDGNRDNLNSENIEVVPTRNGREQRKQKLKDQIERLTAELRELEDNS